MRPTRDTSLLVVICRGLALSLMINSITFSAITGAIAKSMEVLSSNFPTKSQSGDNGSIICLIDYVQFRWDLIFCRCPTSVSREIRGFREQKNA